MHALAHFYEHAAVYYYSELDHRDLWYNHGDHGIAKATLGKCFIVLCKYQYR